MNEGSFAKMSENIVGSIYRELMYATYGTGLAVMELSMLLEEEIYSRSHSQISDNQYSIWKNEGAVKFYGDLAARVVRNINRIQLSADEWRIHYEKRDIKNLTDKLSRDSGVGYQQKVPDKKTLHTPPSYAPEYNPLASNGDLPSEATSKFAKQLIADGKVPVPKAPVAVGDKNVGALNSSSIVAAQTQKTSNITTSSLIGASNNIGGGLLGGGLQRKTSETVMTVDWGASMASVLGAAASTQQQEWGKARDAFKTDAHPNNVKVEDGASSTVSSTSAPDAARDAAPRSANNTE